MTLVLFVGLLQTNDWTRLGVLVVIPEFSNNVLSWKPRGQLRCIPVVDDDFWKFPYFQPYYSFSFSLPSGQSTRTWGPASFLSHTKPGGQDRDLLGQVPLLPLSWVPQPGRHGSLIPLPPDFQYPCQLHIFGNIFTAMWMSFQEVLEKSTYIKCYKSS